MSFEAAISVERPRLVRQCARLTGDSHAAEDLAQETLIEAWRSLDRLEDPEKLSAWLAGVARNVCLRWARRRGIESTHRVSNAFTGEDGREFFDELPSDDQDALASLERSELAGLLDRALALLPAETRAALIGEYVHELPQDELAGQLRMSPGALRVRLHRGKVALRRYLTTDLRLDAIELGLVRLAATTWQTTRIWCPFCGRHHLETWIDRTTGALSYRCTGPCVGNGTIIGRACNPGLLAARTSVKTILTRQLLALNAFYRQGLAEWIVQCHSCGALAPIHLGLPSSDPPIQPYEHSLFTLCPTCGVSDGASLWHLTLDLPVAQRFWRRHPRVRALPIRAVEFENRPALATGFASLDDGARLDVIAARDSFAILRTFGGDDDDRDPTPA